MTKWQRKNMSCSSPTEESTASIYFKRDFIILSYSCGLSLVLDNSRPLKEPQGQVHQSV